MTVKTHRAIFGQLTWHTGEAGDPCWYARIGGNELRGEAVGNSKLTEADAKNIVRRWASGETQYSIATAYGISQPSVSMIVNRKNWAWIDRED